jgi:hypothetical protein
VTTFFILYVLAGFNAGHWLGPTNAWGGPALLRFEDLASCEAAAAVIKGRKYVVEAECVRVTAPVVR